MPTRPFQTTGTAWRTARRTVPTVLLRLGRPAEARAHARMRWRCARHCVRAAANVPEYREEPRGKPAPVRAGAPGGRGTSPVRRPTGSGRSLSSRRFPHLDGEYIFYYAGCHALLSAVAGVGGTGVVAGREGCPRRPGDGLAAAGGGKGYRNAGAYRTETALDPLRGRDDFRLLMLDLAFPSDPIAPLSCLAPGGRPRQDRHLRRPAIKLPKRLPWFPNPGSRLVGQCEESRAQAGSGQAVFV